MKKQKKITLVAILLIVLLMGIGYAAITTVTLTINGKATATADAANFTPHFTEVKERTVVAGPATAAVAAEVDTNDNTKATVNITGLSKKGDSGYAIIEIINESEDVNASSINVKTTGTNTNIFTIDAVMCNESGVPISDGNYAVASGAYTYVKVSATVEQTPLDDTDTDIVVTIDAVPETPGALPQV